MRRLGLALVITLAVSILTDTAMARTLQSEAGEAPKSVSAGVWGGQSLHLEVTAQGATLEFDCATGTILEPLVLDAKGRFRVNGTFQSGNFGPARKGVRPASQPTIYTGTIDGETMRIEFTLPGNSQPEGPFTLTRGSSGRLRKCQ